MSTSLLYHAFSVRSYEHLRTARAPASWHRDRMVLVGDAAHVTSPSSGQGASLAIEDALMLARCLRDLPDHRAAARGCYGRKRCSGVVTSLPAPGSGNI